MCRIEGTDPFPGGENKLSQLLGGPRVQWPAVNWAVLIGTVWWLWHFREHGEMLGPLPIPVQVVPVHDMLCGDQNVGWHQQDSRP